MTEEMMATEDDLEVSRPAASWTAPPGVLRHSGGPLEPGTEFFAEPPEEIGRVISADSSLREDKSPRTIATRTVVAGMTGWAVAMLVGLLPLGDQTFLLQFLTFGAVAPLAWYLTGFRHSCSYVGTLGMARYRCSGRRDRIRKAELFLFADAAELRSSETPTYHNGVYIGTYYRYTWTDAAGKRRFRLGGSYHGEKKPPKPKDKYHFAVMGESAWTGYLFEQAARDLAARGEFRFRLGGDDFAAIGPGFLRLKHKGKEETVPASEIRNAVFEKGQLKVKRIDAEEGWLTSKGVYSFPLQKMANARAFLMMFSTYVKP